MIKNFKQFNMLTEKLVSFGGKIYPKFNNVVILAGGGGSGKGFVLDNLLGIDGKVYDVDHIKTLTMKMKTANDKIEQQLGVKLKDLDLSNPEDLGNLHHIVNKVLDYDDRYLSSLYKGVYTAAPNRLPNLIFDVTMKDFKKFYSIVTEVAKLGYDKSNIHVVWVVNDVETAIQQNSERPRRVPIDILRSAHTNVSSTLLNIVKKGPKIKKYMDGDIVFVFSKRGVDNNYVRSKFGGGYFEDATYFYVKKQYRNTLKIKDIPDIYLDKLRNYTPIDKW